MTYVTYRTNITYLGLPHDQRQREQTSNRPKYKVFEDLTNIAVELLPYQRIDDGIFLVRSLFSQMKFDEGSCSEGLEYLGTYQRKFNKTTNRYTDTPLHNLVSDYADGFRYICTLLDVLAGGDGTGTAGQIDTTILSRSHSTRYGAVMSDGSYKPIKRGIQSPAGGTSIGGKPRWRSR